jgi:hypothetical protein
MILCATRLGTVEEIQITKRVGDLESKTGRKIGFDDQKKSI